MMQSLYRWTAMILITGVASCAKEIVNEEQFFYGNVAVELAALPNTPEVEVYLGDDSIQYMVPGQMATMKGQTADKKRITLYEKGTKKILADTLLQFIKDSTLKLKVAYSESLGMKGFLGASSQVHRDSVTIRLFNNLTVDVMPEGTEVDAILFEDNAAGETVPVGPVWEHFERGKLHPLTVTVPAKSYYILKFKDRATGGYLSDFSGDILVIYPNAGKYSIVTTNVHIVFNIFTMFVGDIAEL